MAKVKSEPSDYQIDKFKTTLRNLPLKDPNRPSLEERIKSRQRHIKIQKERMARTKHHIERYERDIKELERELSKRKKNSPVKTKKKAKEQLEFLNHHEKIEKISLGTSVIHIYTKELNLHSPNGKTAILGKFKISFFSRYSNLGITIENLTNKQEGLDHPHGVHLLCAGPEYEEVYSEFSKANIYYAVDLYIHILETFNPNDSLGLRAGLWFKEQQYSSKAALKKDLVKKPRNTTRKKKKVK